MAADAALLEAAVDGAIGGRWYRWAEPTLSLGHFQKGRALDESTLPPLPRVRRLSGGGAIVHHLEWTYALAAPRGHWLAATPERFYEAVHEELIAALAAAGVAARLRGRGGEGEEPTLCFLRSDPRDVVVADAAGAIRKVVGSAQRRRKGAVLQHGSLLAAASPFAPEAPGLRETVGLTAAQTETVVRDAAVRFGRLLGSASPSDS